MMEDEEAGGRVNVSVSQVLPIVVSAAILLFSCVLFPALSFGASDHAIRVGLTDSARVLSIRSSSPFFLNLPSGKRFKVSERVTVTRRGESLLLNTRVVSASSVSVQGGDGSLPYPGFSKRCRFFGAQFKKRMERSRTS